MHKNTVVIGLVALISFLFQGIANSSDREIVGIIATGLNENQILLPFAGEKWVGLYQDGDVFRTQEVILEKKKVTEYGRTFDKIMPVQFVQGESKLKYLFRNLPEIEIRQNVPIVFSAKYYYPLGNVWTKNRSVTNSEYIFPGEARLFEGRQSEDGIESVLLANGNSRQDYPKRCFEHYSISVAHQGSDMTVTKRTLYQAGKVCNENRPKLKLAGDLDGDLMTDFLFMVPVSKDQWKYFLYLTVLEKRGLVENGVVHGTLVHP